MGFNFHFSFQKISPNNTLKKESNFENKEIEPWRQDVVSQHMARKQDYKNWYNLLILKIYWLNFGCCCKGKNFNDDLQGIFQK